MSYVRLVKSIPACLSLGMLIFVASCSETTSNTGIASFESDVPAAVSDSGESATATAAPKSAPPSGYRFEAPVRIKAGGEYVSVESPGYACPTMADVDGDGKQDLVVGQFNKGYMQFCKNIAGSNEPPEFTAARWILSGDDRAEVPGVW